MKHPWSSEIIFLRYLICLPAVSPHSPILYLIAYLFLPILCTLFVFFNFHVLTRSVEILKCFYHLTSGQQYHIINKSYMLYSSHPITTTLPFMQFLTISSRLNKVGSKQQYCTIPLPISISSVKWLTTFTFILCFKYKSFIRLLSSFFNVIINLFYFKLSNTMIIEESIIIIAHRHAHLLFAEKHFKVQQ